MSAARRGVVWGCFVVSALLVGCGGSRSIASRPGEPVRLVYWPPPNRFDLAMSRVLVDEWNRTHPAIQVEMQPLPAGRSSEEVLLAAMVGKTTPDICSNILTGTVQRMVRAQALVPLSRQFGDFERYLRERLPADAVEQFRNEDGQFYQVPWKANPMLLLYNTRLFAEAGVQPPQTYSQFLAAAAHLTRDRDGDGRVDQWAIGLHTTNTWWKRFDDLYPLYIAASGGQTLIKRGHVLFAGPAMVKALGLLRELFARGYAPRSYFAAELFMQSKVAMVAGTANNIADIEALKLPDFHYDFMPMPVPDDFRGTHYTFGDIKSMVIFKTCRHPEAAWEFLKYLTSARSDLLLLTTASQIPLRQKLLEQEPFASALGRLPLLAKVARQADRVRGTDDTVHLVEIFDTLSQAYEGGAVYQLLSPEEAVAKAARRVQRILEQWN